MPKRVEGRETTVQDEGRRSGMRDDGPGQRTSVPNEGTKYPVIKSKIIVQLVEGNEDPPCGYTEGRVTLNRTCNYIVVKVNVSGMTLYVTGNHVMY